jgi:LysM repeat protein
MLSVTMRRLAILICILSVAAVASACVYSASEETINQTAVSQLLPSLTPTAPSPEPEIFVITATPDLTLEFAAQSQATQIAQVLESTIDPLIIQVTETYVALTQQAFFLDQTLTATADFQFQIPTETATFEGPLPTFTLTPGILGECVVIVAPGQNLFRIGLSYNVPYQTLASYNGIANAALISIGQEIRIPNCSGGVANPVLPVIESGGGTTTVGGTTTDFGTGSTCGSSVVVEQNDTLFKISLRCNVAIRTIQQLNGIGNPDLIYFNATLQLQ